MFCDLKQKISKNRCCCLFQLGWLNGHLFGKELFIRLTVCVFRECSSFSVCASFPFSSEGGVWNLIVLITDRCPFFTFLVLVVNISVL